MIWATVSSWSCFYWLYRASSFLAAKNIISLIDWYIYLISDIINHHCSTAQLPLCLIFSVVIWWLSCRLERSQYWDSKVKRQSDPLDCAVHGKWSGWPELRQGCWRWVGRLRDGASAEEAAAQQRLSSCCGPAPERRGAWMAPVLALSRVRAPEPRAVIGNRHLRMLLPSVNHNVIGRWLYKPVSYSLISYVESTTEGKRRHLHICSEMD